MGGMTADKFWESGDWQLPKCSSMEEDNMIFSDKVFTFLGFQNNNTTYRPLLVSMSKHILKLGGTVFKWPECQKFGKSTNDIDYFVINLSQGYLHEPLDISTSKIATPLWLFFSCVDRKLYPTDYIPFFRPSKHFKPLQFKRCNYKLCLVGFTPLKRIRNSDDFGRSKLDIQVHLHFLRLAGISYFKLSDLPNVDYIVCGRNTNLTQFNLQDIDKPIVSVDWIYAMYNTGREIAANSYHLNLSLHPDSFSITDILGNYKVYISHMAILSYGDLLDICKLMGAKDAKVINPITLLTEELELSDREIVLVCHPNGEYPDLDYDPNLHPSYGLVNYISTVPQDEYVTYNVSLINPDSIYEAKRTGVLDVTQLLQMDTYVESVRVDRRCVADSSDITINDIADSVSYRFNDLFCESSLDNVENQNFMRIVRDYQELSTQAETQYRNTNLNNK